MGLLDRRWSNALAIICAVLVVGACTGDGGATATPPAGASTGTPPPTLGGVLVIYSGRAENLVSPLFQKFEKDTGIDIQVRYAGTPELAATLKEEGTRSPADIFYAQDPGGLGVLEDMFQPLPENVLSLVPGSARSPDGKWVGLTARARTLVYNTKKLTEADLPDDIWDLTDPKWKGRLGWAPTNVSFQTMVTAMIELWGRDKTEQWLRGMVANQPRTYPNNVTQVQAASDGEIDVGLVNHYYLQELKHQGQAASAANYHPRAGGPGALVMVSGAGILSTAKNKANAERFLAYALSPESQQWFADNTFEYPVTNTAKPHPESVPLEKINAPTVSMEKLAALAETQRLLRSTGVLR